MLFHGVVVLLSGGVFQGQLVIPFSHAAGIVSPCIDCFGVRIPSVASGSFSHRVGHVFRCAQGLLLLRQSAMFSPLDSWDYCVAVLRWKRLIKACIHRQLVVCRIMLTAGRYGIHLDVTHEGIDLKRENSVR